MATVSAASAAGCEPRPRGHISKASYPSFEAATLIGHDGSVMAVRFTATGAYAVTAGRDKMVKLWNPYTGLCIKTYKGHGREVHDAAASGDNSRLVSCGADRSVYLWDVTTGTTITRFRGHVAEVNAVVFGAESTVVISGSYDKSVRCWDMRSNAHEPIQVFDEAKDSITSLDVGGAAILTGSVDGHVRLYDLRMGKMREDLLKDPVTSVSFSHDQNCLLASTLNSTIRLLDRDTGESLAEYSGHRNIEYKVDSVLSHNDAYVISGSENGDVCYWELVESRMVFCNRQAHASVVASASYHPTKAALLTAAVDGTVKLWQCDKPSDSETRKTQA
mmetsp:Transcript_9467/g.24420  ORF Transcript_9467/g.24420 Transcript_9467/m.24420 type:complete len:333 (-) Transcript_9467:99-1097(-)|eukprot:CAMPEP_0182938810 /NCGR_PEP_ID=MMETSP0105_2-20130417/44528_1 /TAXON_ID=81532 ORGANISM="Acanthoeca-like sp., Strain 10tr" /NCGR_SAMPLE_ID=MMETSP0105_2 /ASSEMBLY_ACC=CAM_ASM_000205 /LENGTH=332 /DNA_ID=CAMNT_0025078153 /DNA_START=249 /DNA_END=1247 /DNA_ORIENTATION=-